MFLQKLLNCLKRRHVDPEEREEDRKEFEAVEQRSQNVEKRLRFLEEEAISANFHRRDPHSE